MDRRRFLQLSAAGIAAASLPVPRQGFAALLDERYDLAIVRDASIADAVASAVHAVGGITSFVKPGAVVFLKPNMSFPNPPSWGSTTHPDVIRAVVKLCVEAGAKRVIAADFPMSRAAMCFERSGMNALVSEVKELSFVELKDAGQFETIPVSDGQEVRELAVAKLLRKADVFINLPTAKSHTATSVSMGLKNLMGLFWNRMPFHNEHNLHNAIADLATIMKPQLTILDGAFALVTNGPQGPGKVAQPNTIIAGTDPVAVDAAGCALVEWNDRSTTPEQVAHIANAAKRGLGTMDISALRVYRG
jgi:uncharacterized protein (DUF362 family)